MLAGGKFKFAAASALAALVALPGLTMAATPLGGAELPLANSLLMTGAKALDWVVIAMLVASSIAGVALIIDAMLHIREQKIVPVETTEHLRTLINARQFKELMDFTATDQSFVSQALNAGLRRAHLGYSAMREAMESAASAATSGWFRRIEMMNVIGNIGPLIGLLGTVLGMIVAFLELGNAGGAAKVDKLAPGISMALLHTFLGLLVAIPCLVVFGLYRTKVDKITSKATVIAEELLESLRPAEKGGATTEAAAAKPAPKRVAAPAPAPAPAPAAAGESA